MGDLTMDFLRLMLMAAMLLTSLQGQAADAATAPAPTTHEVEFLRSADKACRLPQGAGRRHARQARPGDQPQQPGAGNLHQLPWSALSPTPGRVRDVMRFSDSFNDKQSTERYPHRRAERGLHELSRAQSAARGALGPTCTPPSSPAPAATSCTRPREPMVAIPEKSRIKLCVDCHSKQHEAVKAAKANTTSGKEVP